MVSLLLRNSLLLTLLMALPIFFIRAQPYDDSELRAFLTPPEGCPAPCFMGIRPGVTTAEEAIAILEGHEWVADVTDNGDDGISWSWSNQSPNLIDRNKPGYLYASGNLVGHFGFATQVTQLQVWMTFGIPLEGYVAFQPEDMLHHTRYNKPKFRILTWTYCPAEVDDLMDSVVTIEFGNSGLSAYIDTGWPYSGESYREQLFKNLGC